ncbi:MAG TPA: ATP-binding protein, partial [Stellaceae bacterium]|nr:ATP-binding protein [Stellaceae bacterium]
KTAIAAAFGAVIGLGSFFAVDRLPIRALDRALAALQITHAKLKEQVVETRHAYDQLQLVHRKSEETADELARALAETEVASRTKSEFLANMSHELRTPLNAIIGFSDILMNESFGPSHPSYRGYAKDINDSGNHLLAIIVDILDLSKIQAGKLILHPEIVDLSETFRACSHLVSQRAEDAGVRLVIEPLSVPIIELSADRTKLKQIVINLLSNSIKFTPKGGTVTITTEAPADGRVSFAVRDTGIGMSAGEIATALQPFRQIDNSQTRRYQGTGLGLPLAKALAELHGGELKVTSEPGRGTAVTVVLPLHAPSGASASKDMAASALEVAAQLV